MRKEILRKTAWFKSGLHDVGRDAPPACAEASAGRPGRPFPAMQSGRLGEPSLPVTRIPLVLNHARKTKCDGFSSIQPAWITRGAWLLFIWLALPLAGAVANNLSVTNTRVIAGSSGTAKVQFDIAWENSWRFTNVNFNHDAAWVFFKVQVEGAEELGWRHVTLSGTGTNPAGYATGTGTGIELIVPGDRKGLFLQRSATNGAGALTVSNVTAVWSLPDSGISPSSRVKLQTLAIEMVFVPQGAFWAGNTNAVINTSFRAQSSEITPFYIFSEDATNIYWGTGAGTPAALPAAFPKGFAAFYCMKYEISQGQYADFLNRLTTNQAATRAYLGGVQGHTITWNAVTGYTATARDRACNWISWADGAAYADWAALRPMTELEFEKACRGPWAAVEGEYAWGNATAVQQTGYDVTDGPNGSGRERALPAGANVNYESVLNSPVRVGIYATTNSTRAGAGASYWGIMELSGNLHERPVTVGHATGLLFTGLHGDGALDASGNANVTAWPVTDAVGAGYRGGSWYIGTLSARAADRSSAAGVDATRFSTYGGRGVRQAP